MVEHCGGIRLLPDSELQQPNDVVEETKEDDGIEIIEVEGDVDNDVEEGIEEIVD